MCRVMMWVMPYTITNKLIFNVSNKSEYQYSFQTYCALRVLIACSAPSANCTITGACIVRPKTTSVKSWHCNAESSGKCCLQALWMTRTPATSSRIAVEESAGLFGLGEGTRKGRKAMWGCTRRGSGAELCIRENYIEEAWSRSYLGHFARIPPGLRVIRGKSGYCSFPLSVWSRTTAVTTLFLTTLWCWDFSFFILSFSIFFRLGHRSNDNPMRR